MPEPLLLTPEEAQALGQELKAAREAAWREGRVPKPWNPERLPSQPVSQPMEGAWLLR